MQEIPSVTKTCFLVPTDYDFGGTSHALDEALLNFSKADVVSAEGHHSSFAINVVLKDLAFHNFTHVLIASNKAISYLDEDVVRRAMAQFGVGMRVVGVRIKELDDVHEMQIENTLAFWELNALKRVGWFDSEVGVEEITPLIRITRKYGQCAALISGVDGQLSIRHSEDGRNRHKEVKETKRERQEKEAQRAGKTIEWLNRHIEIVE
ncbi:MAG: hypothetical protein HYS51_00300 [Candidatus Zambryskibacteria bacterium]|nr:hypothetical protein [Candidatus Zambryskibacteria bacterium]